MGNENIYKETYALLTIWIKRIGLLNVVQSFFFFFFAHHIGEYTQLIFFIVLQLLQQYHWMQIHQLILHHQIRCSHPRLLLQLVDDFQ